MVGKKAEQEGKECKGMRSMERIREELREKDEKESRRQKGGQARREGKRVGWESHRRGRETGWAHDPPGKYSQRASMLHLHQLCFQITSSGRRAARWPALRAKTKRKNGEGDLMFAIHSANM